MGNRKNYSIKLWDNSYWKAILDGIEFWVSKIIYKGLRIKEHRIWGWGLIFTSKSLCVLRCTIASNEFSSDLETHKRQIYPIRGWKKVPPKVNFFSFLPVPYPLYFRFNRSNGFSKSSKPLNLKYFDKRNLRKYKRSS